MESIIPRDISLISLTEQDLISFPSASPALMRAKILHEVALRRENSKELKSKLNQAIVDERNRNDIFFGFIKVAWIPIIDILENGDKIEIMELKDLLKKHGQLLKEKIYMNI